KQLESLTKAKAEQERTLAASHMRITQLEQNNATLTEQLKQLEAQHLQGIKTLEQKLEDSTQEGDLTLLQLHQVQEELEHYFSQIQALQAQHSATEARLRKMQERYPDYVEYGAVEVQVARTGCADWQLQDLMLV